MAIWTDQEIAALEAASPAAGGYLERLGKTDLTTLTYEQWMTLLETAVGAYLDAMAASAAPYAPLRSKEIPF